MLMRSRLMFLFFVAALSASFQSSQVVAQQPDALSQGQVALAGGDLETALKQLTTAVQNQPESVPAHFSLGECHLRMGKLAEAIAQFRTVLRLSPDHTAAKSLVETLTGTASSFEIQIKTVEALIKLGAYTDAISILKRLSSSPLDAAPRQQVQLLLSQCYLYTNAAQNALPIATRLIAETNDAQIHDKARIISALSLLMVLPDKYGTSQQNIAELATPIANADEQWTALQKFAVLRLKILADDPAIDVAKEFGAIVSQIPSGQFRRQIITQVAKNVIKRAEQHLSAGNDAAALATVWPVISGQAIPTDDALFQKVNFTGGWLLDRDLDPILRLHVSQVLTEIARVDLDRRTTKSSLLGYWLFSEAIENATTGDLRAQTLLSYASLVGTKSRPTSTQTLTTADRVQTAIVLKTAALPLNVKQRQELTKLIVAQLVRYQNSEIFKQCLEQFVSVTEVEQADQSKKLVVNLVAPLARLHKDSAHKQLLETFTLAYIGLGNSEFSREAATLQANANNSLHRDHEIALNLLSEISRLYQGHVNKQLNGALLEIVNLYSRSDHWDIALAALQVFYANDQHLNVRWPFVELKINQARTVEDRQLASSRKLGEQLHAKIVEAIAETVAIYKTAENKTTRQQLSQTIDQLIARYTQLNRIDLAEAVIGLVVQQDNESQLADWVLWTRINLLERQAAVALLSDAGAEADQAELELIALHQQELNLINQLLADHPKSDFIGSAVDRVLHIASTYQNYRSFDTARGVLNQFVAAHANLSRAESLRYRVVQITLDEARYAFDLREDKTIPPAAISDEFAAAIQQIAAFIKAHPNSATTGTAQSQLLGIARTYGQANAWPVARAVLDEFAKAIPDYRRPQQIQLWQAATFLGELDQQYGLNLLQVALSDRSETTVSGDIDNAPFAVALNDLVDNAPVAGPAAGMGGGAGGRLGFASGLRPPTPVEAPAQPEGEPAPDAAAPSDDPFGGNAPPSNSFSRVQPSTRRPNDTALAMIRQSQQRQFQQLAMLEQNVEEANQVGQQAGAQGQQAIALPSGSVLSEAEMKRQDDAADKAYAILIDLIQNATPATQQFSQNARVQVFWLFGFFEGQLRADRAIAQIDRFLADRPDDPARVALSYQAINDRLAWATQRRSNQRIDQGFLDARRERFEQARREVAAFVAKFAAEKSFVHQARMLIVTSYEQQSDLAAQVSAVRAGGLLVQAADELLQLLNQTPVHPQSGNFPQRLWNLADRLRAYSQHDGAIYVLSQIPLRFPMNALAAQSVMRIAELNAANLANPLKAVEAYQEYLSLNGDNDAIRSQIISIAQQLSSHQRYLEALHVFAVFVDNFPTDARAPDALRQIGLTHQSNDAWEEAIKAYERVLEEYPSHAVVPQIKLAMAECQINLSGWKEARRLYEEFAQQYPKDGQTPMATARIDVLKNLERYQNLLADNEIERNKDDAQFQIGRIVLQQLSNPVKAVVEFGKVVSDHAKSDLADDAQIEIGRALLSLGRLVEARQELLKVPENYPNSPSADNALFLIGKSYETQAQQLAMVTVASAKAQAFRGNQKGAYWSYSGQLAREEERQMQRRDQLKKAGKSFELGINEAADANKLQGLVISNLFNTARAAQIQAETESALQVASRQDRVNEAYREAVKHYVLSATDYPLGDQADDSLLRIAAIFETQLKDRPAAMETYQKIVKLFPGTPVAQDAAWKVALFYEQESKFTNAAASYRDFIRNYPASPRVADAQFALAEVLEQLGKWVDAMDAYETFRQKFKDHPKALVAAKQISWIKTYRK